MKRTVLKACTAWVAAGSLLAPTIAAAQGVAVQTAASVTAQPQTAASGFSGAVPQYFRDPATDPTLTTAQKINLLRHRVKYVFVVFQENRSFDHYFGTFPGANGLFADASATPSVRTPAVASNTQVLYNTDGTQTTVSPFRIGTAQNAADLDDIDHGHTRMVAKMDAPGNTGTPSMDRFAVNEQFKYLSGAPILTNTQPTPATAPATVTQKSKQYGELAMAYVDCDTIPFMWNYANRFTLFDNIFQTTVGPSTPNALAMISGQSGDTQWVRHPTQTSAATYGSVGVPITNDPLPGLPGTPPTQYSGNPSLPDNVSSTASNTGAATGTPQRKNEFNAPSNVAPNLTFASLPMTLAGRTLNTVTSTDTNPAADLADVQNDIAAIMAKNGPAIGWGWYQNGYNIETNLPPYNGIDTVPHASYIGHHNGPQYFGYVTNNPAMSKNQHGLGDFFTDINNHSLPSSGGVFYVRGGYDNIQGLRPDTSHATGAGSVTAAADAAYISANFLGDDDHPAYSDSQISESMLARTVNAIASSRYWNQSAIVVTYDESEGDYDHVPPRVLSWDPAGLILSRGPRIPLLVISPYARTHVVSHEEGDHNSVIQMVNNLFGLTPLADLPDEAAARLAGQAAGFNTAGVTQTNLGPHDGVVNATPGTGSLLSAFDPARLMGTAPVLPASYAMIDPTTVATMPHFAGAGCTALGITPLDTQLGVTTTVPSDFFARPSRTPN
jgi:phospholipase C